MRRWLLAAAVWAVVAVPTRAQSTTWEIDPTHTSAQFGVRHLAVSTVRGEFTKVSGNVRLDEKDITRSAVEATIDATTLDTREARRDAHLRSADFLDVANHPTITFRSKRVARAGRNRLKVTGDLMIRGVTREVVLQVEGPASAIKDPWGNIRSGATATTKINRKDFGLAWNVVTEAGGLVVGDEVAITIDLELVKKAPAAAAKPAN